MWRMTMIKRRRASWLRVAWFFTSLPFQQPSSAAAAAWVMIEDARFRKPIDGTRPPLSLFLASWRWRWNGVTINLLKNLFSSFRMKDERHVLSVCHSVVSGFGTAGRVCCRGWCMLFPLLFLITQREMSFLLLISPCASKAEADDEFFRHIPAFVRNVYWAKPNEPRVWRLLLA